jgi:hypothetical protein
VDYVIQFLEFSNLSLIVLAPFSCPQDLLWDVGECMNCAYNDKIIAYFLWLNENELGNPCNNSYLLVWFIDVSK